ncbi:hypothetical protein [Spiroplasma eriocheiris]|uniref:Lipoprotein n=1 Tax=Spiroplasma eriocheiris TaxID=315358 RepID=A0A0H3XLA7_9MOLU|nr:hypothetical protein [Spiroplasma eriocheiris]AHF57832.1 putative lipoprotein [Spiroplasma eriocheiris CCTCC M 207170]AKM54279.1 hypothetical protein SERIO_v1c07150 [Spiroplasma eriocheiris]
MKKMLASFAAISLISSSVSSVVACKSELGLYNTFMSAVNNKDSFIMLISAQNCPHCQALEKTTINELYDGAKGNAEFHAYLNGKYGADYNLATYYGSRSSANENEYKTIENTYLMSTWDSVEDYNKVWGEKWAKKILDWVVAQERNAHKINGEIDYTITADSLKLKGTPLFIYVKQGQYMGFESGDMGSSWVNGATPQQYMYYFVQHLVKEDWDTSHDQAS